MYKVSDASAKFIIHASGNIWMKSLARNVISARISFRSQCLNMLNFILTTKAL